MRRVVVVCLGVVVAGLAPLALTPSGAAADTAQGKLVRTVPVAGTPHALDGQVNAIAQVGDTMIIGGTFTRAQNADDDTTTLTRNRLLAFDKDSGQISTTFLPNPDGPVEVVLPTGDGETVWVGGDFRTIGGVARQNLARIRVADGTVVEAFNAGAVSGKVLDLKLSGGRLWVAGAFTNIANRNQAALATLNPTSGALVDFFRGTIDGLHNGGTTTVLKMDVTPAGDRLVAVGNFDTLDGVKHHQILILDTSGASAVVADFNTTFYQQACSQSFDSYMRDVDISPDGTFAVVSTTGAYGGAGGACDSTARWETHSTGTDVRPSWIDNTGGDTTYAVEVTDSVVYTGGHARWQNNPFAADNAGQGAVARPGIAALDPATGLPFSWNPTRTRGVGVFDFLHTADGLWVGSDTDRIGDFFYRGRIALLPDANGTVIPGLTSAHLPNDVYLAHPLGAATAPVPIRRVNAGGPQIAGTPVWSSDSSGSGLHNGSLTRNSYANVGSVDASVPAGTPSTIFNTELVGNSSQNNIAWNIPNTTGQSLEVRLFFANRNSATNDPGERRFHIDLEGTRVVTNFDVAAAVGHNRGMMRSFQVVGDGNLDLDLVRSGTGSNNYPLINGIEILNNDTAPAPANPVVKRGFDGTTAGADTAVDTGGRTWSNVRGTFMLNGFLYTAWNDGSFVKQTFDGGAYGTPVPVNGSDLLTPLVDWQIDIKAATSMFYENGRIYFTRSGDTNLYYRYFNAESDVVGAQRLVASASVAGVTFSQVRGAFAADGKLYYATPAGALVRIDWSQTAQAAVPVPGTATTVSGPGVDGRSWSARGMFLYQGSAGGGAPQPPSASFTFDCSSLDCTFDASGSLAPNANIVSYAWDFGDGSTGTGGTTAHTYPSAGTRTVSLTVTTDKGGVATTTRSVAAVVENRAPVAAFTQGCAVLACAFDAGSSTDVDGDPLTYQWDFGDGATGTGRNAAHTYAAGGTYRVTLTASDGTDTGEASRDVTVVAAEVVDVASTSTAGNRTNHSVTVPGGPNGVRAGDTLLLFLTTNSSTTTLGALPGWNLLETTDGNGVRGRAWTRTATAADAGSTVTVTTSALTKSVLALSAYRNPAGASSVTASGVALVNGATSSVTSPPVDVGTTSSWLVTYWSEKSTDPVTWTTPASATVRTQNASTGSGKVSAVLGDSGAGLAAGPSGGLTASTSPGITRAVSFSVVVTPELPTPGEENRAPEAAFTRSCTAVTCTFDASASVDADGDPLTYHWAFGDGSTGTGKNAGHTYAAGGSYTVTLTVSDGTDSDGASQTFDLVAPEIVRVGAASTAGNRTNHTVTVPAAVQAGDTLLLFLTTNSTATTVGTLPGWTAIQTTDGNGVRGRVWSRTATAADAGSTVAVATSATSKSVLAIGAYRNPAGATLVAASNSALSDTATSSVPSPQVAVTTPGSWLVTYWSEKSSVEPLTWTTPAAASVRTQATSTGSGKVSGVLADSAGAVATGTRGGLTATASAAVSRTVAYSVVLTPEAPTGGPNSAPVAAFTQTCTGLTCSFDAGGSTDADGDPLTYHWAFGDGQAGSGRNVDHTYAAAGNVQVTLTVSDGTDTDAETKDLAVEPAAPTAQVVQVGAASTAGNRSNHTVTIPASVQAGDTLLLFLTTNSTATTIGSPAGWTSVRSVDGNAVRGRAWTRTATATDAGSTVTVTTSGTTKSVLAVGAYRNPDGASSVAASQVALVDTTASAATTPTVPVATPGSWLVSWWSEKSSVEPLTWNPPAAATVRTQGTSTGSGKISAVLADSGAGVPVGQAGGLTASTSAPVSRTVAFSVVVAPQ